MAHFSLQLVGYTQGMQGCAVALTSLPLGWLADRPWMGRSKVLKIISSFYICEHWDYPAAPPEDPEGFLQRPECLQSCAAALSACAYAASAALLHLGACPGQMHSLCMTGKLRQFTFPVCPVGAIACTVTAVLLQPKTLHLPFLTTDSKYLVLCCACILWGSAQAASPVVESLLADSVPTGKTC